VVAILVLGSEDSGAPNVGHEESALDAALKDLGRARERMKSHLLRTRQDIERRKTRAAILATTGQHDKVIIILSAI
jgi:hypothetical protein